MDGGDASGASLLATGCDECPDNGVEWTVPNQSGQICLAIASPALREEMAATLDDVGFTPVMLEHEVRSALELTERDPALVLFDVEAFTRLPPEERRLLKQAGIESMLIVGQGKSPYLPNEDVDALTDYMRQPVEPVLLKVRIDRALAIFKLRRDVASTTLSSGKDATTQVRKSDAEARTESGRIEKEGGARQGRVADLEKLKSSLITIISHEFKTPLHLASGYINLLLDGSLGKLSEQQHSAITTLSRQIGRLSDKLADIERIAQLESGITRENAEVVDLDVLLQQEIQGFEESAARRDQHIQIEIDPRMPPVLGCRDFLADVFRRLIDNAIHYTGKGGTIGIRGSFEDGNVVVRVRDTGCGIPEPLLGRIFDRFGEFRDIEHHSSRRSGLGLGLAICRHLVEVHDGTIDVESKVGEGSVFSVRLPALKDDARRTSSGRFEALS